MVRLWEKKSLLLEDVVVHACTQRNCRQQLERPPSGSASSSHFLNFQSILPGSRYMCIFLHKGWKECCSYIILTLGASADFIDLKRMRNSLVAHHSEVCQNLNDKIQSPPE
jgi:hypothetical protein